MSTVTSDFTALGGGNTLFVRAGTTLNYSVSGTFDGTVRLERSIDGGLSWDHLPIEASGTASGSLESNIPVQPNDAIYRFSCIVFASGTIETSLSNVAKTIVEYKDENGASLFKVTEEGVEALSMSPAAVDADEVDADEVATTELTEQTAGAGVKASSQIFSDVGDDDGASALSFGINKTEGLHIKVIEETVDLTDAGAKFVAMTTPIPAGAVILSAQANIEALAVAGGTSVKVALGINDGDVDAYGKTSALTKNLKIDTIPAALEPLASETPIDVCAVVTNGSALGDSNFTAGSVRVRIVYLQLVSLTNAT